MRITVLQTAGVIMALSACFTAAPATAQGVIMRPDLSIGLARAIADAAFAACQKLGPHSLAVLDRAGQTMVLLRDERTPLYGSEGAERKAYTALAVRRPSLEWARRLKERPELEGQRDFPRLIPLGGGVPIKVGNDVIGAVGAAGGPTQEQDEACAKAGIDAVADRLK
jgi:uncharacterized protein GlcG (DUF336 family)